MYILILFFEAADMASDISGVYVCLNTEDFEPYGYATIAVLFLYRIVSSYHGSDELNGTLSRKNREYCELCL